MKELLIKSSVTILFCLMSTLIFSQTSTEDTNEVSPFSVKPANYEENMKKRSAEYEIKDEHPMYVRKVKKDTTNNDKNNSGSKTEHRVLPVKSNEVVNTKPSSNSSPQ